jgi:hypothetical protein
VIGKIGGPGRDRTDDLFHAMEARSQLRHRPTLERKRGALQTSFIFAQQPWIVKRASRHCEKRGNQYPVTLRTMKLRRLSLSSPVLLTLLIATAVAQALAQDAPQMPAPVSYASLSQLNTVLAQLEQTSQTTQLDVAKLRIDKWKADGGTKRDTQSNADSVQRNLHSALPEIIGQLRSAPEDLEVTFKLYRNLSALYDVFNSIVESAGAFGPKDDFQALENDLSSLDQSRRSLGDRMDDLAAAKDAEIKHLRTSLQAAQTSLAQKQQQQKKVVVEDDDASKPKPVVKKKKKTAPKTSGTATKPESKTAKPGTTPTTPQTQPTPQQH